MHYIKINTTFN